MEEKKLIKDKKDKTLLVIIGALSLVLIVLFIFFLIERSKIKRICLQSRRRKKRWNKN